MGGQMPSWPDLPMSIRDAWEAAAQAVRDKFISVEWEGSGIAYITIHPIAYHTLTKSAANEPTATA
jgi:hypothetical protein